MNINHYIVLASAIVGVLGGFIYWLGGPEIGVFTVTLITSFAFYFGCYFAFYLGGCYIATLRIIRKEDHND